MNNRILQNYENIELKKIASIVLNKNEGSKLVFSFFIFSKSNMNEQG